MRKLFERSDQHLTLPDISEYYEGVQLALSTFYLEEGPAFSNRFQFENETGILLAFRKETDELERSTCLTILAAIEAKLRLDYLERAGRKLKDPLSRAFREAYQRHTTNLPFDDLLEMIKQHHPELSKTVGALRGALHYRHWLAHGRYWKPSFGRKHGFADIFQLAYDIEHSFPVLS